MSRIMSRSPFFVSGTGTGLVSASIYIFIWSGSYASKSNQPNYQITKTPLKAGEDTVVFELSSFIRDYFDHNKDAYDVASNTFSDVVWVDTSMVIADSGGLNVAVETTYLAVDGYTEFSEGSNADYPHTDYTISVPTGEDMKIPVQLGAGEADSVEWYDSNDVLRYTDTLVDSTDSREKVEYVTRAQGIYTISKAIILDGITPLYTVTIINREVAGCESHEVKYLNKNGELAIMHTYGRIKKSISVNSKEYRGDLATASPSFSYDVSKHQKVKYEISGTETIVLSTGFISEDEQEAIKQLLLSKFVWLDDQPVIVRERGMDIKTHRIDKLIDFSLKFELSNDIINDIY